MRQYWADSMMVEAFRDLVGFEGIPYMVQAYLVYNTMRWISQTSQYGRDVMTKELEKTAIFLTDPYWQRKLWEVDSAYAPPQPETYALQGEALEIMKPILEKYKGKYIQIR